MQCTHCYTDMTRRCSVTVIQLKILLHQQNTNIIKAWRLKIVKKLYNPGMQNTEEKNQVVTSQQQAPAGLTTCPCLCNSPQCHFGFK